MSLFGDDRRVEIEWDSFRRRYRWAVLGAGDVMIFGWELTRSLCQERIGDELVARRLWLAGVNAVPSVCRWYGVYSQLVSPRDPQVRKGTTAA